MRIASGSEPHRRIKDKYLYFWAWAQERQRNPAERTADTRPGGDLAVLRDVALAGGRRWDRGRVIPKSSINVYLLEYFIFPVVKSRGFLIFFIKLF